MNKVTPFLMFNDQLEAAIEFYAATFPNSEPGVCLHEQAAGWDDA